MLELLFVKNDISGDGESALDNTLQSLKKTNYRSFVNYWVPVYGGIGIHDATWRDEFGGKLYKKSGSHGCINTPLEKMEELYDMLEIGMPVVIHY